MEGAYTFDFPVAALRRTVFRCSKPTSYEGKTAKPALSFPIDLYCPTYLKFPGEQFLFDLLDTRNSSGVNSDPHLLLFLSIKMLL